MCDLDFIVSAQNENAVVSKTVINVALKSVGVFKPFVASL